MKARIILCVLVVLAMAAGLVPSAAYATQETNLPGTFVLGNIAPTLDALTVYEGATPTQGLDPLDEYSIKVTVTDSNSLNDLTLIKVYLYYDADGVYNVSNRPGSGNAQNCMILQWSKTGLPSQWTMQAGSPTTWSLDTANCTTPSFTDTSGYFQFFFKVGKVAKAARGGADPAEWHLYAEVTDSQGSSASRYLEPLYMAWYGEITAITDSVSWSTVHMDDLNVSPDEPVSATIISNGNYSGYIKTNSPWANGASIASLITSGSAPSTSEFSLKANDHNDIGTSIQVTTNYSLFSNQGTITPDVDGSLYPTNMIWLSVGIGLISGTYAGTVWYEITSRN